MPMHMGTQLMLIIKYIQKLRVLIHPLFKKLKYILNLYEEFKCIFQDIKSSKEIHPPEAAKTVQVSYSIHYRSSQFIEGPIHFFKKIFIVFLFAVVFRTSLVQWNERKVVISYMPPAPTHAHILPLEGGLVWTLTINY